MNAQCLNLSGLILSIIGTIFLSYGLIINKKSAIELGVSRYSGSTEKEKLNLPQVKDRLKQSKNAFIGMIFLVSGLTLQVLANL